MTLLAGTIGFRETLHESWFQSFYRAVVTMTLTGLDTVPDERRARAVSIVLVVAGLTIIAYAGAVIVEAIAGGVLTGALAERRRERTIEQLHDHFIICGYGRVGRRVGRGVPRGERPPTSWSTSTRTRSRRRRRTRPSSSRATRRSDENLREAGLERAQGLVAASDSDADNLYIVLSARRRVPTSRSSRAPPGADAEQKLALAGADRVVLPYTTAGPGDGEPRAASRR